MAQLPSSNTDSVSKTDRAISGSQPDNSTPTGGTTPTSGSGFANPMTTLGDMIYGGGSPNAGSATRLPGSSAARRAYLSQLGTGTASAKPDWRFGPLYNVADFGGVGSAYGGLGQIASTALIAGNHYVIHTVGTTNWTTLGAASNTAGVAFVATGSGAGTGNAYIDDTFAIQAAINAAVAAGGGMVYFPSGLWLTTGVTITGTVPIGIVGDGADQSQIGNMNFVSSTAPLIQWYTSGSTAQPNGYLGNIGFFVDRNRTPGNAIVQVYGCSNFFMEKIDAFTIYDCFLFKNVGMTAANVTLTSGGSSQTQAGTVLRAESSGCGMSNCLIQNRAPLTPALPPLWVTGVCTSLLFNQVTVVGAGSKQRYTPTTITSTSGAFTVAGLAGHTFQVNDFIVLSGMTPSGYNGYWRISGTTSTTVTVTTTANPGTTTVNGSAYSVPCCVLFDLASGSINESSWIGGQLGADGYPLDPISAGFYFDGRAGNNEIEGWTIDGAYIDIGRVGVLITGGGTDGAHSTSKRFNLIGLQIEGNAGDGSSSKLGDIWIEQTPGVNIVGLQGSTGGVDASAVSVQAWSDGTSGHLTCRGLKITGSDLGGPADVNNSSSNVCKYGLVLDGPIDNVVVQGCIIQGQTAAVLFANGSVTIGTLLTSEGNQCYVGSGNPNVSDLVPTIASAGTITLPFNDAVQISGTTTLSTINGGWCGRVVQLLMAGPAALNSAGNIKAAVSPAMSTSIALVSDGTAWWPA